MTKFNSTIKVTALMCLSLLGPGLACTSQEDGKSSPFLAEALPPIVSPARTHGPFVSFSNWTDTMQIDSAVLSSGAACKFIKPIVIDDSTKWSPFQIYWVIRDDESDVHNGTAMHDIFFAGDKTEISEFPGALGYAYLNPTYANLLALESIVISADETSVQGKIGSPFNAVLRLDSSPSADQSTGQATGCVTKAFYCLTSEDCTQTENFQPLTSIHVEQNFLGYPTEVNYN